jgi:hypothetical protein
VVATISITLKLATGEGRTQRSTVEHGPPGLARLIDSATVVTPAAFYAAIRTQLENSSADEASVRGGEGALRDVWGHHDRSLPSHPRTDLPRGAGLGAGRKFAVAHAIVACCAAGKIMMPLTRLQVAITALP